MTDTDRKEGVEQLEKTLNNWIVQLQEHFGVTVIDITFNTEQNRWIVNYGIPIKE